MRRGSFVVRAGVVSATVLIAVGLGAVVRGSHGAIGVAIGTVIVAAFFLSGRIPVKLDVPAGLAFLMLGMGYVLRIMVLLLVFRALRGVVWVDKPALAGTVIVGAVLWSVAQVVTHVTSKQPTIVILPKKSALK